MQRDTREEFFKEMNKMVAAYEKAVAIQEDFKSRADLGEFKDRASAQVACSLDYDWRMAVQDEQFAERLANLYCNATTLAVLDSIRKELMALNDKFVPPRSPYKPPIPWRRPQPSDIDPLSEQLRVQRL